MASQIETPSGKTARDENFPVGSLLLSADKRPHVAAYYAFARAVDDIADSGALSPDDKVARLDAMGSALSSGHGDSMAFGSAHALRGSLIATGVPFDHALDLLVAFRRDAVTPRTKTWAELMTYCRYSAAPVGRFLLDLHREDRALWPAADALCGALQVLNHLQDIAKDLRDLDRVYLPEDWLTEAGIAVDDLRAAASSPRLRRVIDRCLDGVDEMMALARTFPRHLRDRRLAMESGVIVALADRLTRRLRAGDPLATRVKLTPADVLAAVATGVPSGFFDRAAAATAGDRIVAPADHVRAVVARSGSSFTAGMRILPRDRRQAMYAVYAFCREVDDAADEPNPVAAKRALLADWRAEIAAVFDGTPTTPTGRALYVPVRRYRLPRAEFLAVIDGMESDVTDPLHAPDLAALRLYCRRVAGAVGLLSLGAFGASGAAAERFAIALGEALQLTNILRDLDEDGRLGRLYLPREILDSHGIDWRSGAAAVLAHPALDAAARDVAKLARERFAEADAALAVTDRRALRPALLMMGIYEDVLDRLEQRGWRGDLSRVSAGKAGKLKAALLKGLFRPQVCPAA